MTQEISRALKDKEENKLNDNDDNLDEIKTESFTFRVTNELKKECKSKPVDLEQIKKLPAFENIGKLVQGSKGFEMNKNEGGSVYRLGNHSFIHAACKAYNEHYGLIIRPDDIWMSIMTQFSFYVNNNAESLRNKFVNFEGKKELIVEANGTLFNAPYEEMCLSMEEQIGKNIKDPSIRTWIVPNFSTTQATDRVVGSIVLMSTMKNYFDYTCCLLCNLTDVTLLGTLEDWQNIRKKAERLTEFEIENQTTLKQWSDMLLPVLDKFIQTKQGKIDKKWWNSITNFYDGGSGSPQISGWITVFSVFSAEGNWLVANREGNWFELDTYDIADGIFTVPITVDDNGTIFKTQMFAGHFVCDINTNKSGSDIQPRLDWGLFLVK